MTTPHTVKFSIGEEWVLVSVPDTGDIAKLLNFCRARIFPGVEMIPAALVATEKPQRKIRERK